MILLNFLGLVKVKEERDKDEANEGPSKRQKKDESSSLIKKKKKEKN